MTTVAAMPTTVAAEDPAAKVSKVRPIVRLCCALMIDTCISMALDSTPAILPADCLL